METALQVAQKLSEQTLPVGQDTLQQIASILVRTELKKGENFLDEGAVCSQIGYIYKGLVRQYYYKNGKQLTEHFSCENDVFICIESFLRQKPSTLIVEPLLQLAAESHEVEELYRGLLENSLILSQVKMDMFRFESANERYNRLMHDQPEIIKRAPLSYIASYLLMTPETLSRVRANII